MRANYIMKDLSKNLRTRFSGLGLPTTSHSILNNVSAILPLSLAKEYVLKLIRLNTNTIRAVIPSHTRPRSKGRCGAQMLPKCCVYFPQRKCLSNPELTQRLLFQNHKRDTRSSQLPPNSRQICVVLRPCTVSGTYHGQPWPSQNCLQTINLLFRINLL